MKSDSGWVTVPLPEVIDFQEGPGIMARDFRDNGTPLVRLAGLNGGSLLDGCNYLDPEMVERRWAHFALREGDTLLSTSASLGRTARVTADAEGAIAYTGLIRMRPRDGRVSSDYVRRLLQSPLFQRQVEAMGSGSVMRHFGPTHLRHMTVLVPPVKEQEDIDAIVSALDEKIESNRRLALLLEETASALFRARFVDFVGVTDLVESEIGPIPRDWTVRPLSHLGRFINGGALTKDATGSGRLIIRIAEMKNGPGASTKYTDALVADDQVARPGDLLFAWSGSLGVSRWTLPEAVINQHIFKCVPSGDAPEWLLEQCLLDALPEFIRIAADKATTMGHIRRRDLDSPRWAVPPTEDLTEIDAVMAPLLQRRIGCLTESHVLAELRDTLLPKLVSGQIRVREAEQVVESV